VKDLMDFVIPPC